MTTDWVHTFLSDGVFGTELLAFLKKSEEMIGKGFASFFSVSGPHLDIPQTEGIVLQQVVSSLQFFQSCLCWQSRQNEGECI